jgi:hypothetical protein
MRNHNSFVAAVDAMSATRRRAIRLTAATIVVRASFTVEAGS